MGNQVQNLISQMSRQVSRGSAGEYQEDEQAGVALRTIDAKNSTSKSGVSAGCSSLSPADILDQIILRYDGQSCGSLAASLVYSLDDSGTQLPPPPRLWQSKMSLGTAKYPQEGVGNKVTVGWEPLG